MSGSKQAMAEERCRFAKRGAFGGFRLLSARRVVRDVAIDRLFPCESSKGPTKGSISQGSGAWGAGGLIVKTDRQRWV
ncbi:hypothetical protein ACRALDRAFT_2033172 [Sodiomyces alcalophilus JCM 7366]|uniref:uncharacterized protein n=1 Tax=Sodiomyces alcalophilus JCM 7366 TaxID=591952 RepID=UPI0039B5CD23